MSGMEKLSEELLQKVCPETRTHWTFKLDKEKELALQKACKSIGITVEQLRMNLRSLRWIPKMWNEGNAHSKRDTIDYACILGDVRVATGCSESFLAEKIGVSEQIISDIFNNKGSINKRIKQKIDWFINSLEGYYV